MTTSPIQHTNVDGASLRLPSLVEARVHQTRALPTPMSFTDTAPLWMADMDRPLRLSRWTHPFGHRESPRFSADALSETKNRILHAAGCAQDAERVVMLADPSGSHVPAAPLSVFWCLDGAGRILATLAEVHGGGCDDVFIASAGPATAGHLTVAGTAMSAHGNLRTHLSTDRVAVGLQLFDEAGSPLVTFSLAGTIVPASVRSLLNAAARAQNAPRLAAV